MAEQRQLTNTKPSALIEAEVSPVAESSLRKAVEAIAVKPHAGKLTLLSRKIANVLLAEAQKQGVDQTTYRIALSRLSTSAHYESTNTQVLKEQLRKMASTSVEWNVGVKGSRRWGVTNLVNVEIIEENNRCWIEWDYPAKLKAKLLTPDVYARLSLQMQANFRSAAALALYEICVRYVDSPGGLTMRMPWQEWRPILTGMPDDDDDARAYAQYKYFKRDVLKKSVTELNSITNIEVALIEHKQGRSVTDLQFTVRHKKQQGLPLEDQNLFDLELVSRLVKLGLPQAQAEKIYTDTEEDKLKGTLDYVEKRLAQKNGEKIESPAAYFRHALSKGYGVAPPGLRLAEQRKAIEAPKPKAAPSAQQLTQRLLEAWRTEKRQEARAAFDVSGPAEQAEQLAAFESSGTLPPHLAKRWKDKDLTDKMCAATFATWLMRDIPTPSETELLQYGLLKGLLTATT